MELYNSKTMPLSNDSKLRNVQEKILKGEALTIFDKMILGRDHVVKELDGYKLKTDHCYRAVSEKIFNIYESTGFIIGIDNDDEYQEYIEEGRVFYNNKGVDWYLGGVSLKYGMIVLECPASKEYFVPSVDNGCGMSMDPTVRHFKSSGSKNPIPMSMITHVFDCRKKMSQNEECKEKNAER